MNNYIKPINLNNIILYIKININNCKDAIEIITN